MREVSYWSRSKGNQTEREQQTKGVKGSISVFKSLLILDLTLVLTNSFKNRSIVLLLRNIIIQKELHSFCLSCEPLSLLLLFSFPRQWGRPQSRYWSLLSSPLKKLFVPRTRPQETRVTWYSWLQLRVPSGKRDILMTCHNHSLETVG